MGEGTGNVARSAPGRHYRRGLSLAEVTARYPDDASAEAWFAASRWPDGPRCPRCGGRDVVPVPSRRPQPWRCRSCRRYHSVRTGTVMEGSNLGCRTWLLAVYLLCTGLKSVSSMKLHRDLGVTQKTAWHLAHRVREAWGGERDLFTEVVEADEAYFGGRTRNMSARKRRERAGRGRGPVDKAVVAGVVERGTGRVSAAVVGDTRAPTLQGFVRERVGPGSTVYTDEHPSYAALGADFAHEAVRHKVGEYVRGAVHTNGVEAFWSEMRRGYVGTFHKVSPKHLARYVREFAGRHNARPRDTADMMRALARGMEGRRLRYRDLVAPNGLASGARPLAA